tara:strand:- start:173 stop:430 length:258 start_codon:yes stop_codon:yes gene_type:complete
MQPWEGFLHATESLIETLDDSGMNSQPEMVKNISKNLMEPFEKTRNAVSYGVAISQMDGPLPIMDIIGASIAVYQAAKAWWDYFD